jgi:LuxR family maltose regulon positive regulatory protein
MLARYLLAKARHEQSSHDRAQALSLLQHMVQAAEAGDRTGALIRGLTLLALALTQDGQQQAALESLARALVLAEPEGCVRVFVDEGPSLIPLLSAVLEASINGELPQSLTPSHGYVRTLLAALGGHHPVPLGKATNRVLVEPLSERELEVLYLLADELSSNQIAERLIIAVETARKHIKNIYSKLDVHSREEAVRRGRALGLL